MKKIYLVFVLLCMVLLSCKKDDDDVTRNQNIPNAAFDTGGLINTSLPQFNNLLFPGNFITLNDNYGINGIVVYYVGGTNYKAYELSDPNHQLNSCSRLTMDGTNAVCNCDDGNSYLVPGNGLPQTGTNGQFSLVPYPVEVNGNIIRVFNN
ncbi:hypothetical protein [Pontimicrobium sp. MEBiC01747]